MRCTSGGAKLSDRSNLPPNWESSSKARRILREAPAKLKDEELEEPETAAGKIIASSLKHEIAEEPGPVGSNLIKTIAEVRGIRTSIERRYRDPFENAVQKHLLAWTPADTENLLFLAANRHLRAKGRPDHAAVMTTSEIVADAEDKDPSETATQQLRHWREKIQTEFGSLSIEAVAANFIQSSDRLFMLTNADAEIQAAAQNYADAWHWLHLELMGEHELAAKGADAERGRKAGPAAKRDQGALRSAIIELAYNKFAAEEPKEANRTSTKYAAEAIFEAVNAALRSHRLDPIALGTIKNQLPAIIKAAKPKRD